MEAGRKCQSGAGLIVFETTEGNTIFHDIQTFVNSLSVSQPLNGQKGKPEQHGSHENLHSKPKKHAVDDVPPPVQPRSKSVSSGKPVVQTKEFKDRIALRKQQRYEDRAIGNVNNPNIQPRPTDLGRTFSTPADQIYSEVSDQQAAEERPRMPPGYQEPEGDYDLTGDMAKGGPLPPDSDEYDELSVVYTDPKERQTGDAWKEFGLEKDNIHTETYISGQDTALNRRSSDSPKGRPRNDQRKAHAPQESVYSVASGGVASPPKPKTAPPPAAGNEVYDHLDRHNNIPKPKPVPRRPGPTAPTTRKPPSRPVPKSPEQHKEQPPIYDHLDRQQQSAGKPGIAAKPKDTTRRPSKPKMDPNATYGHLYDQDQEQESAYGHLSKSTQDPIDVAPDQEGYLTRADIAHQDYHDDQDYDELGGRQNNGESLYDLPE